MICDFCESESFHLAPSAIPTRSDAVCSICGMVTTVRTPAAKEPETTAEGEPGTPAGSAKAFFGRGQPGRSGILYGWGGPQAWGAWSVGDWAAFELAMPISRRPLAFQLTYQGPADAAKAEPSRFDLYIQERFCGTAIATGPDVGTLRGRLPLSSAASGGRITFELHQKNLSDKPSGAPDQTGIGLISCEVWPVDSGDD